MEERKLCKRKLETIELNSNHANKTGWEDDIADNTDTIAVLPQQNDKSCDITLFGKDSAALPGIKAHKIVLSAASPHFRAAFDSEGLIDSHGAEYRTKQIENATLQTIVDFIYGKNLQLGDNTSDCLKSVMVGADYLLMTGLVGECGRLLGKCGALNVSCAVNMWLFARKHHCKALEDASVRKMALNMPEVIAQADFVGLKKADVIGLLASLTNQKVLVSMNVLESQRHAKLPSSRNHTVDDAQRTIGTWLISRPLNVAQGAISAGFVCEAATTWLGFKQDERKVDCDEVMRQVPLKLLLGVALQRLSKTKYLSDHVLWTVQQVQHVQAEAEKLEEEKLSLTNRLDEAHVTITKLRSYSKHHGHNYHHTCR